MPDFQRVFRKRVEKREEIHNTEGCSIFVRWAERFEKCIIRSIKRSHVQRKITSYSLENRRGLPPRLDLKQTFLPIEIDTID